MIRKIIILLIMLVLLNTSLAQPEKDISLDLQRVSLADALHGLAKITQENIVVNPVIRDQVSLHVHHVTAEKMMTILLHTHDLLKISLGKSWYITPRQEWVLREQQRLQADEAAENVAPLITEVWQIKYAKAEDIMHLLQDNAVSLLSKRGHVRADSRTNMVYVQDTAIHINQVHALIKRMDIPVRQVLIEARLASVDQDVEQELGIHFSATAAFSTTRYSLLVAKLADGSLLDVQLSALENSGRAELISSPRLFTANQQTASIESGEEIPYQQESLSGGTYVVFKKAVLSLKVTPQILPDNKVLLQLQLHQDRPSKLVVQGVPAINTRQMSTNVLIHDGQTVVLGGIYESNKEHTRQAVPFVSKIPVIGLLFQENNTVEKKRELLIFLTLRVVSE